MKKRLVMIIGGLFVFTISTILVIGSADAETGRGRQGNPPKAVPEPISCVLFAAGGGTLVGLRYLRNRRKSKESIRQDSNVKDGIS